MSHRPARAALLLVLAMGCVNGGDNPAAPEPAPLQADEATGATGATGAAEATQSAPPAGDDTTTTARPSAELEGSCRRRPQDGEQGPELIARLRVVNTGNLGVVVRVSSHWPLGADSGASRWTRVRVEQEQTERVTLRLPVSEFLAAQSRAAAAEGRRCFARSRVTGAFGLPSDG